MDFVRSPVIPTKPTNDLKLLLIVRCLAAAPWFAIIFSIPTALISWVALHISNATSPSGSPIAGKA